MRSAFSLIALTAVVAISGCGEGRESSTADDRQFSQSNVADPGPIHVHGLGLNPADGSLFIATHTGLFRAPVGDSKATRVADRYQDTMGFTVVGKDTFLGSGHPDHRDKLPPFLGLIRSTDAGRTWEKVSLLGKSDFHVLEASGKQVYGYGSDFKTREQHLLVSTNGGRTWRTATLPEGPSQDITAEGLLSLAIDPRAPERVVASGPQALWRSEDAGRNWALRSTDPGYLAWPAPDTLYRADTDGTTFVSADDGRTWKRLGDIGGEPAAFEASGGLLLAALHDGTVKQSRDGRSWAVRSRP